MKCEARPPVFCLAVKLAVPAACLAAELAALMAGRGVALAPGRGRTPPRPLPYRPSATGSPGATMATPSVGATAQPLQRYDLTNPAGLSCRRTCRIRAKSRRSRRRRAAGHLGTQDETGIRNQRAINGTRRQKKARGNPSGVMGQNEPLPTADKLAADYGVSPATVKRAGKTATPCTREAPGRLGVAPAQSCGFFGGTGRSPGREKACRGRLDRLSWQQSTGRE